MKTNTPTLACLFTRLLLIAAAAPLHAAPHINFTDSWKDFLLYDRATQTASVTSSGAFTMSVSLPLNGASITLLDPVLGGPSEVYVGLNFPNGTEVDIVDSDFGQATSLSMKNQTATFPGVDDSTGAFIGHSSFSWSGGFLNFTITIPKDILLAESLYTNTPSVITDRYELVIGFSQFTYDNPLLKITGNSLGTNVFAGGSAPYHLRSGSIHGTGDALPPKLSVTSPAANTTVYDADPVIHLQGAVSDNEPLTGVQLWLNTGGPFNIDQTNALGTNLNWTATIDLRQSTTPGPSVISVVASDVSGNSSTVTRHVTWLETNAAAIIVDPPGAGKIVGLTEGQRVFVGSTYHLRAVPSSDAWIVSSWGDTNGNIFGQGPTLDYVYPINGPLVLTFAPNQFKKMAGIYTATFSNPDYPNVGSTGYLNFTLNTSGAFSGHCWLPWHSQPYPFSGVFLPSDQSTWIVDLTLGATSLNPTYLEMLISSDTNSPDVAPGFLSGTASDAGGDVFPITGEIAGWPASTNLVPGLYNLTLSGWDIDPANVPSGFGFLSTRLASNGAVSMTLNLPDGATPPLSFNTWISPDGTCPIYAPLYGGKGYIIGSLQYLLDGSHQIANTGPLVWLNTSATGFYPNGFQINPGATGVLYSPPKSGTNTVASQNLDFIVDQFFSGTSLPDETDLTLIYNPRKNTFADTNHITAQLQLATGALGGTFLLPGTKHVTAFHGLIVGDTGYGFYVGTNHETGSILVTTNPPLLQSQN
jgi:hypothetical protein